MKFTLSWLKEHLATEAGADEVAARLTAIGIEVESVVDRSKGLEGFVVAHVLAAEPHPNADRLKACTVDFGEGPISVVCGAINARAGMKAVLARPGQYVPGIDVTLKKASIRGVESNGMMLSEDEIGLGSDHSGIIEFARGRPHRCPRVDVMGLSDPSVRRLRHPPPRRLPGRRGIARDLAASGLGKLKPLDTTPVKAASKARLRSSATSPRARATPAPTLSAATFAASGTARARAGSRSGWPRLACARSRPWSTSPTC